MKQKRHFKIREIIREKPIETQEELAAELRKEGFNVTQATVSRDIKELKLIKVLRDNEHYCYAEPEKTSISSDRLLKMFKESIISFDTAENLIVIKTSSGTASAVAEAIDGLNWSDIVGTVAGDNTILIIAKSKKVVNDILKKFEEIMR
ncbi:arginine repressor [Tepidanaerobacter sp. EBM-38]|uniref:arginine repressor n=1 Tax=Tepidanaerobacter sp. EBM-38 TaxID=1918496 RepID=UPI000B05B508|nr:arginine repressor [Tepidanaerobacter sp. EBM-38]